MKGSLLCLISCNTSMKFLYILRDCHMTVGSTPMQSVGEFRRTVKRSKNTLKYRQFRKCIVRADIIKFLVHFEIVLTEMFYENSITYCFQIDSTSEMHSKCLSPKCHAKAIRFFKTSEHRSVSEMFQTQILQLKCIENCCLVNQSIVYYY